MTLKKICIVVQRYGKEINGGAEQHARRIAERLVGKYDVEVITSTALETTWEPNFPVGQSELNGVKITRFNSTKKRDEALRRKCQNELVCACEQTREVNDKLVDALLDATGLVMPDMLEYIKKIYDKTDMYLFITYLFYHSVKALPLVADKVVFLPTAHDEPQLYYPHYDKIFQLPRYFMFNSEEEMELVHRLFDNSKIPYKVVGEGVDTPPTVDAESFKKKFGLQDYIIYVGRVSAAKYCDKLIEYFRIFKHKYPSNLKLVFVGRSDLNIAECDDILFTGFVTDQEKFDGMSGAKALVMPSGNESLCMAVLEAMSVGTAVIVNGKCLVTKGHCIRSNAGLYYENREEFEGCLKYMLDHSDVLGKMSQNGIKYVRENYNWDITLNYIDEIMKGI